MDGAQCMKMPDTLSLTMRSFNLPTESEHLQRSYWQLRRDARLEYLPDDPAWSFEEYMQIATNFSNILHIRDWVMLHGDEIIAYAHLRTRTSGENRRLGEFNIVVKPQWRRKGLATRLLPQIYKASQKAGCTALLNFVYSTMPAGNAYMATIGARKAAIERISQLDVAQLNRSLLQNWQRRAAERAEGIELVLWEGMYPDEAYEPMAAMYTDFSRSFPKDDVSFEDEIYTPEMVRSEITSLVDRGNLVWTLVAREGKAGAIVGFTICAQHPSSPQILEQDDTGVLTQWRNCGIGRLLKATMLLKLLPQLPQVRYIRTENAESNAAMLSINEEMGFRPYIENTIWQLDVAALAAYIEKN